MVVRERVVGDEGEEVRGVEGEGEQDLAEVVGSETKSEGGGRL